MGGKVEKGIPKYIANKIKSKSLQKLRWYCQMCQKQCRDENGFKCHTMSETHQSQRLLFADNANKDLDEFSKEFLNGYLELLKRQFGTKRVNANKVYQDYIANGEHINMNATQWETLTEFVKWLGREGKCTVDETEKGCFVTFIDRDPVAIAALEAKAKKERMVKDDQGEPRTSVALASGDCYVPRCRLCGGHTHLKHLTVDHCDDLLRRLFEVKVPSNGKICESCIKCLKICERFKALVHATFEIIHVESPTSCDKITETFEREHDLPITNPEKEIIELLKTRLKTEKPKRRRETVKEKVEFKPEVVRKRANISCEQCRQKYPMLVASDSFNFICSRCKQIELKNIDSKKNTAPRVTKKQDRGKMNSVGKSGLNTKNQLANVNNLKKFSLYLPRHQCRLCPKKYTLAQNLATHVKLYHEASFACTVCGKRIKNKELFEKHMRQHSDLRKMCNKVLKKKRSIKMPVFQDNLQTIASALEIKN